VHYLAIAAAVAALACDHAPTSAGARDVRLTSAAGRGKGGRVTQEELQEDIHRFAGQLMERTGQASLDIMGSGTPDAISTEALRRGITYESAALDIATEPLPEVAVLDMLVFVRLNRQALADHWIPKVFGERGRPFLTALDQAEEQLWPIVSKITNTSQREALVRHIDEWRRRNPDAVLVSFVRLTDFSAHAGSVAVARQEEIGGLLASVKSATEKADDALLLGERALFLAGRLPFFLRHQVRLGGREVASDTTNLLGGSQALTDAVKDLQPIVAQLPAIEGGGVEAARESRLLLKDLKPLIPTPQQGDRLEHTLETLNGLVKNASTLLFDLRTTTEAEKGPDGPIARLGGRIDATLSRAFVYLILLGAIWSLLWWGGYTLAKRASRARTTS
jgi:hypothetical protein